MAERKAISWQTKCAAALLALRDDMGDPVIDYTHAKYMSTEQITSLFHFDHDPIPHADGGPDEAWNLTPLLRSEHKVKTAKVDVPTIAKNKRIRKKFAAHQETLVTRVKPKSRWPSRPLRWRTKNAKRNDARSRKV